MSEYLPLTPAHARWRHGKDRWLRSCKKGEFSPFHNLRRISCTPFSNAHTNFHVQARQVQGSKIDPPPPLLYPQQGRCYGCLPTWRYLAPEVIDASAREYDCMSDIYSLVWEGGREEGRGRLEGCMWWGGKINLDYLRKYSYLRFVGNYAMGNRDEVVAFYGIPHRC